MWVDFCPPRPYINKSLTYQIIKNLNLNDIVHSEVSENIFVPKTNIMLKLNTFPAVKHNLGLCQLLMQQRH